MLRRRLTRVPASVIAFPMRRQALHLVFVPGGPARLAFVPRPAEERALAAALTPPGRMPVVIGRSRAGKTSLIERAIAGAGRESIARAAGRDDALDPLLVEMLLALASVPEADGADGVARALAHVRAAVAPWEPALWVANAGFPGRPAAPPIDVAVIARPLAARAACWQLDDAQRLSDDDLARLARGFALSPCALALSATEERVAHALAQAGAPVVLVHLAPPCAADARELLRRGFALLGVEAQPAALDVLAGLAGADMERAHRIGLRAALAAGVAGGAPRPFVDLPLAETLAEAIRGGN